MVVATISDETLAIVVAVATAVGAGVGGTIAGLVQLVADRRRERRELRREAQGAARNLKEAARLVDEELRDATDLIRGAVWQGRWWPSTRQVSAAVYTRYRSVLALALDDDPWAAVSSAFQELNRVNWDRSTGVPSIADIGGAGDPMNPLQRVDLLSVGIAVIGARQALAPSAAPPDKQSLLEERAEAIADSVFPVPEELDEELKPLLNEDDAGAIEPPPGEPG